MVYRRRLTYFYGATVTGRAVRLLRPFFTNSDVGGNAIFTASVESDMVQYQQQGSYN